MTSATQDEDAQDVDEPKVDEPKVDEPKVDEPKAGQAEESSQPSGAGGTAESSAAATPAEAPSGSIQTRYAGRTSVGLVREHNEDNFVIVDLTKKERSPRDQVTECTIGERGMLFSVCDGMGGAAAGEVASQMAVDILFEALTRDDAPTDRDDLARRLVSAVEEAGKKIYDGAQSERERRGMGTTTTSAALLDKVLFVGEVGDSRAYLLRKGTLKQITKDQSLVSQLIEAGHLTEEEAEAFEHSNIILQALGTNESVDVDLTFVELRRGDRLMVCSDGLSGLVHDDSICEALGDIEDPAQCAATLIEYAEAGGGHDNITVIVADFDGEGLAAPGDDDAFGYMQYPLIPADGEAVPESRETEKPGPTTSDASPGSEAPSKQSSGGSMGFIIAGLVALAVGAYVMNLSNGGEAEEEVGGLQPAADESAQPAPTQEPEAVPVEVRIHTDVQEATLLVNGEAHGRLPTDGPREMKLRPGAYRFEAQSGGVEAAVAVVTVRPDIPLDVYLSLPPGQAGAGGAAEGDDTPEPDEAPGDEQDPAQQAAPEQAPAAAAKPGADAAAAAAEERRRKRREERAARKAAATPKPKPAVKVKVKPKVVAPPPKPVAPPPPKQPGIPDNPF